MNKLNRVIIGVESKARAAMQRAVETVKTKRSGEAGVIVAVILIVIAVALLVTFKNEIKDWLSTLNGRITTALSSFDPSK